jgi:H+/gluconate symporter-like permease
MSTGIIILLIAFILFGVLAFRQLNALILAPIVTIFVLVCFGMPILGNLAWPTSAINMEGAVEATKAAAEAGKASTTFYFGEGLIGAFMPNASKYVTQYFLVFFVGALFGAVYQFTGAAKSIAKWMANACHGHFVAGIIMTITGILTYGGISGFVVFFVIYPIALHVFREAGVTRRLIPGAISAGTWTWSMYGPGTPAIQNVIPVRELGTTPTAAFLPSVIITVLSYLLIFGWLEYRTASFKKRGIPFEDDAIRVKLTEEELRSEDKDEDLPNVCLSFVPIFLILFFFNARLFPNAAGTRSGLPVETAVFIGVVTATVLMWKRVAGGINGWIKVFNKGAADSGVAILNTAIVVGFGGVVQQTQGFKDLIAALQTLDMPPLYFVFITVAVAAGACGSASGGLGVAFNALKDTYIKIGAQLPYVHRIAAIASGTLDSLPHQGAQITLLGICKLNHKEGYWDIFITQIVIPVIAGIVFIWLGQLGM